MIGYKFLKPGAVSPISERAWPAPGAWLDCEGPLMQCRNGIHVMRAGDLAHWMHAELWTVEHEGEHVEAAHCVVVRRARLVRRVDGWQNGGSERAARATREELAALVERAPAEQQPVMRGILDDCDYDIRERDFILAAYCAAMGFARYAPDPQRAYRDARAQQSAWIANDLALL